MVFQMAFQYQMCQPTGVNAAPKWYGWMMIGSQSIGTGSWGDVDDPTHAKYFLYHLGIAFFPYIKPAAETGWYL